MSHTEIKEKKTYFVYIAGPLVGQSNGEEMITNVKIAVNAGVSVCIGPDFDEDRHYNTAVYIPHLSVLGALCEDVGREFWQDLSFRWIERCDVLLRLCGYSSGASKEVVIAKNLGIPVAYSIENVFSILNELWERDRKQWERG